MHFLVILPIYFLPSIIAFMRGKPNALPILGVNIVLGWTGIGWIVLLFWSATGDSRHS